MRSALRFAIAVSGVAAGLAFAQDPCAQFGLRSSSGPSGYAWRDNGRCEGLFIQEVAGSGDLQVISFAAPIEPKGPSLALSWQAPPTQHQAGGGAEVHLRATSLRSRHYYRMDAKAGGRGAATTSFPWPTNLLQTERLTGEEIGLIAWTRVKLGGKDEDVYLPVRAGARSNFTLSLLPGAELTDLYVSISRLGDDGRVTAVLKKDVKQPAQYYPAGRKFAVPLGTLAGPGYYRVRVAGLARFGGSATKSILIYLPSSGV